MFSWLFRKRSPAPGDTAPAPASTPARRDQAAPDAAEARRAAQAQARAAQRAAHEAENWPDRLQQALGDDAALLALATRAPGLDIKLAAVEALAGEDALRQAERAFRTRDRKVHVLAKSRLGAAVARRTARATAERLLQRGRGLLEDPHLPLNHLATLEREWQALPDALLDTAQHAAFADLRTQWDGALRARADAEQGLRGWTVETQRALPAWQAAVTAAVAQPPQGAHATLAAVRDAARALLATQPAHASTAALAAALNELLRSADAAQSVLDAPPPTPRTEAETPAPEDGASPGSPTADDRKASAEQCRQLEALLAQADAVVEDGRRAALQQQLQAADALLADARGVQWPPALRHRLQGLRAEHARLKAWQDWGGQRAREDLIAEAEALAQQVRPPDPAPAPAQDGAASEPSSAIAGEALPDAAPNDTEVSGAGEENIPDASTPPSRPDPATASTAAPASSRPRSPRPRLDLRAHAEAIRSLRTRWKALDPSGERPPGKLWQRFDAALTAAYAPLAAQNAAQQAAREQNLLARQAFLDGLEGLALPAACSPAEENAWRDVVRQFDAFQAAWHRLGPVEHTVPAASRELLLQRLQAARDRVEAPLHEARHRAAGEREQLVRQAEALVLPDGPGLPEGETQRQLRRLQAEWQEQARRLPLQRATENDLWTRFRAATDAVFARRDAAAAALAADQAAEVAQREALVARLEALTPETPIAQIDKTLGEVDRAWQQAPVLLPRAAGQALETRYRGARAVAAGLASTAASRRWQAQIDACIASVQAVPGESPDGAAGGPFDAQRIDERLLRLEVALDLPAPPERLAERRQWKLRALKEALEGGAPAADGPEGAGRCLAALLACPALADHQRERLLAVLKALRDAPPGTLGLTLP